MPTFRSFEIHQWRQFDQVSIEFHPRLTVLTGANGAGKTTILNVLNRHFGWSLSLVSTPHRRRELARYLSDTWEDILNFGRGVPPAGIHTIGAITYTEGNRATIRVPADVQSEYHLQLDNLASVPGLFISSHRPVYFYQLVDSIPTKLEARDQLLTAYMDEMRQRYTANNRVRSPSHRIKSTLISLATFGYGNEAVVGDPQAVETFEGFERVLREVLPPMLGFKQLRIAVPDVVLETESGDFSIDAVSGGVSAIVDQVWQIYMYSLGKGEFCVLIDEPENHLHPELQRTLLPSFIAAFPQVQFIVSTHNPFIVGSVPDSNVYVLAYTPERKVRSQLLDTANKAGSSNEILRDVLGLSHTMPIWVERRLDAIVVEFGNKPLDAETLNGLKREMDALGLGNLFPNAVSELLKRPHDQT